jgi:hypothetical protein
VKEARTNVAPELAAAYAEAFTAYLAARGERELGAAYDIGRQAIAARLSVLDLAEAHHAAVRAALADGDGPPEATLQAGADFLRESLSIFESVHRGYTEVQEVARLEHHHHRALREGCAGLHQLEFHGGAPQPPKRRPPAHARKPRLQPPQEVASPSYVSLGAEGKPQQEGDDNESDDRESERRYVYHRASLRSLSRGAGAGQNRPRAWPWQGVDCR